MDTTNWLPGNGRTHLALITATIIFIVIIIIVLVCSIIVYIRHRRKRLTQKNHVFEASAEELYRRPFNKRSSVVESHSRANSVKRRNSNPQATVPATVETRSQAKQVEQSTTVDITVQLIADNDKNDDNVNENVNNHSELTA